jgi:catechol 2,3-dioxygenase-like lactoylglutathione lyase family enzyme
MTLVVSDLKRSIEFYQGLFGMPIQARLDSSVLLRVGAGPQYLGLHQAENGERPGYSHYGMGVEPFNAERVIKTLTDHGVMKSDTAGASRVRVVMRGQTPEIFVGDPDGLIIQLQDTGYCGGTGPLGDRCAAPETSPRKGLLALQDLSHFTLGVFNAERSRDFYQKVLGMVPQAYQGPGAPVLGVGKSRHFIMAAGGLGGSGGAAPGGSINHGCFSMAGFQPDQVTKTLGEYGIKPRESGRAGPLVTYISMRMENRGGAKEGTPELYFTDPDGILLQLQDTAYCGGGGFLGDICL